ncbi:MAG TPA: 4Fe-4S dicluster domain-containing protein [Smithella sp.]|nr:4Fe-4S dicluster domain-containing protein [Smithella sp.]HOG90621.1 4Fe-4S dicluster domain-containing protein [Smithella sp.]
MDEHSSDHDPLKQESPECVPEMERRSFLKIGLVITGVLAGGTVLSLISNVRRTLQVGTAGEEYPYKPHYAMVIRQDRCIGCERCMQACISTNHVPSYGWRTRILEKEAPKAIGQKQEFIPVLCNHCNNPPCVRSCPTQATFKNKKNGIVMMNEGKCIGCKSCMIACPYDARYFNEEKRAIDKCDFCFNALLERGETNTACAAVCPADTRVFGDLSDPESRVYQMIHQLQKPVWVIREETGARPNVFYTKG